MPVNKVQIASTTNAFEYEIFACLIVSYLHVSGTRRNVWKMYGHVRSRFV